MAERVLVTGASGFIATHCIVQLLEHGYAVRGTLRSMSRANRIREIIARHSERVDALGFVEADLTRDAGWSAAVADCPLILHIASPIPLHNPKREDEVIVPARDGTLRVLRAAASAGARKVVLTSSVAAITYGHAKEIRRPFTEEDWSPLDGTGHTPYTKSKTIAEQAAWAFVVRERPGFALAAVNPGAVLGPVLEEDIGTSAQIVQRLMRGRLPGVPRFGVPIVDVRDVADLHIRALQSADADGRRFICVNGFVWLADIVRLLRAHFPEGARRTPTRVLPDFVVHTAALFGLYPRAGLAELGRRRECDNRRAREVLGWRPRSADEAILATARSLIDLGLA